MTLPRWVEPDPPDHDGDAGDAGPASADSQDDLSLKPVLEWTNEDWARWVDSPDLALPGGGVDAEDEAEAEVEVEAGEPSGEVDGEGGPGSTVGPEVAPEVAPEVPGPPEWVRLLEEVAPAGAAGVTDTVADEPAGLDEVADDAPEGVAEAEQAAVAEPDAEPEPEPRPPVRVIEVEPAVEEELAPTGEWFFGTTDRPDERDEGPAIITGTFPIARSPAEPGEPDAPWTEEEWAEVAEHPWWQSAPEPDKASARLVALDPEPEVVAEPEPDVAVELAPAPAVEVELQPSPAPVPVPVPDDVVEPEPEPVWVSEALVPALPLSPPAPKQAAAPAPAPTRTTRPAPARPARRPGPAVYIDETSHRIRAAFSLLGVAVLVGTVMAGLIAIVVLAISVALRHAVG